MGSNFVVESAEGYDRFMGRWSRRLAPLFAHFAGLSDGERVLDVGCGTGSLTFALPKLANVSEIWAIDYSPLFVAEAQRRNTDERISIQQGDACALPFGDGRFDRALSLLVLHFVPDALKAVREMRRVVRPGGHVAAAVWDIQGGMPNVRLLWDTIAAIAPDAMPLRSEAYSRPMTRPGELREAWSDLGLKEVEDTSITIRMEYDDFEDFWAPVRAGEGGLGKYVASLDKDSRATIETAVRNAFEYGRGDGPRTFSTTACACRGRVSDVHAA